jgi:oxygen-independent coproporphyrinogen-3 oxidase
VPVATFVERTGFPLATIAGSLAEGARRGLIVDDPARIAATERGRRFLNATLELFLPGHAPAARTVPITVSAAR